MKFHYRNHLLRGLTKPLFYVITMGKMQVKKQDIFFNFSLMTFLKKRIVIYCESENMPSQFQPLISIESFLANLKWVEMLSEESIYILHIVLKKQDLKVQRTGFLVDFELNFYCLCSLQK